MPDRFARSFAVSCLSTLGVASLAAFGIALFVPGGVAAPVSLDDSAVGTVERSVHRWRLTDDLSGSSCEAQPGPRLTGGAHALTLAADCGAVFERLADAVVWQEERDGTVRLADPAGRLVIAFAPTEGEALEAVAPNHAMLSLRRL